MIEQEDASGSTNTMLLLGTTENQDRLPVAAQCLCKVALMPVMDAFVNIYHSDEHRWPIRSIIMNVIISEGFTSDSSSQTLS